MADIASVKRVPIGAAQSEFATLADMKRENYIGHDTDDDTIQRMIDDFSRQVERLTKRPIRKRTYQHSYTRPPQGDDRVYIHHWYGPTISVAKLEVYQGGAWVEMDEATYPRRITGLWNDDTPPPPEPVLIAPTGTDGWGEVEYDEVEHPFRVETSSGFDPIPPPLRNAVARYVADNWALKGTVSDAEMYNVEGPVMRAIKMYQASRVIGFYGGNA